MAVTFVDNKRVHEVNLEYRGIDRPTDVVSLEYKPESEIVLMRKTYWTILNWLK